MCVGRRRGSYHYWLSWMLVLLTGVLLSTVSRPTPAADDARSDATQAIEAARALAAAFQENAELPGLSIAVGLDGEIVWSEGFGYADLEQQVPVTPDSVFRIGSVSKTLTATAVGLLVERGELDLDAPVQRYAPKFPQKEWPITARQLGGHSAGIRHYKADEFLSQRPYRTVTESLEIFANDALLFRPGTDYVQTTYGWSLLSAVVEGAANKPFLAFMSSEVFDRLGMRHTFADLRADLIQHRVRYYERGEGQQLRNAPYVDNSNKWAGGGFLSTPSDLVRFGLEHLRPTLLRRETVALLMQPQKLESGKETDYGIGWQTRFDIHNRKIIGHGGGSVGGTTAFVTWPAEGMVIAATTNLTQDPGIFLFAYALGEIFRPSATSVTGDVRSIEGYFPFTLPITHDDKERATGSILVHRTPAGYRGWLTAEAKLPFGPILWGRDEAEGTHLVATTPSGLVHLWTQVQGARITGRWLGRDGEGKLCGLRAGRDVKRPPLRPAC